MKKSMLSGCCIALLLILTSALPALAHKVRVFAWEDSGNIITEAKFSGGKPAQTITISVIDSTSGKQLLSGKTNREGIFSFPVPLATGDEVEIIADGGDGHKNSWKFNLLEAAGTASSEQHAHENKDEGLQTQSSTPNSTTPLTVSLTREELTDLIEEALDKKLGPIKRTLAANTDQGPTLQDILGGIGYILGLAGIAAYFQSRGQKKE